MAKPPGLDRTTHGQTNPIDAAKDGPCIRLVPSDPRTPSRIIFLAPPLPFLPRAAEKPERKTKKEARLFIFFYFTGGLLLCHTGPGAFRRRERWRINNGALLRNWTQQSYQKKGKSSNFKIGALSFFFVRIRHHAGDHRSHFSLLACDC